MELIGFETPVILLMFVISLAFSSSFNGYRGAKTFYWSRNQGETPFTNRGSQIGPLPVINRVMLEWSSWEAWKDCSRSCGQGVRSRSRTCVSKIPSVMPGSGIRTSHNSCHGDNIQYEMCNNNPCAAGHVSDSSFRASQCHKYNGRKVLGRTIANWLPFGEGGINPCALVCEGEGEGIVYTFGKVIDGTKCRMEDNWDGLCVNGRCMRLSCDNRLGGQAREDMCRVCGGHNETCTRHTGVYHSELPSSDQPYPGQPQKLTKKKRNFGYYEVTKIPRGSTNVKVFDNSSNFLALKSSDKYLLNGDWLIDWPGDVDAGGTLFSYQRKEDQSELLTSVGPTQENIVLMVLLREHNPGIYYEYWTPSSTLQSFRNHFVPHTSWLTGTITTPSPRSSKQTKTANLKASNLTTWNMTSGVPSAFQTSQNKKRSQRTKQSKHKENISHNEINNKRKKKRKRRPSYCKECPTRRKTKHSFCTSDFVSKVDVISRKKVGEFYRVEVLVGKSYKNIVPLSHKEFIWQHRCSCRLLKPFKTYVIMGSTEKSKGREVKLVMRPTSYVTKYTEKTHRRILRLRQREMKICKKWRKDTLHHRKLLKKFYKRAKNINFDANIFLNEV